ncbi:MAG: hypothetical protein COC23_03290 [Hyphomicrobiales bacterium]|nr:MaoC family dehydratase [Ahrensia sp. AH-315-G08]PCH46782.1 MAG: hypothetical protein COC23_03290 [Hyphomicrobiales bacterium]
MLTFEDFETGRVFELGPYTISTEEIIEFATQFDPQPFHIDQNSPEAKAMGGIIASGWQTCGIVMRLMCDSYLLDTASQGSAGLDEIKWLFPVRPGDTLSGTSTVIKQRLSRSQKGLGIVTFDYELKNQDAKPVVLIRGTGFVKTKEAAA